MNTLRVILILILGHLSMSAQLTRDDLSLWVNDDSLNKPRFYTVISGEAIILTGTYVALGSLWYSDQASTEFTVFDDSGNWLGMDKIGHAMSSYYIGYVGQGLLEWSGVPKYKSTWFGGTLGLVFLTGVEIFDGYSSGYGFSWTDMAANAAGTGLLIGQELLWKEQRIVLKYSAHQTAYSQYAPELLGKNGYENMLKDYNGQTYWLSFNVHDLFGMEKWPPWLNIAAGYGADGMITAEYNPMVYAESDQFKWQRQYYASLDIDLRKIPVKSDFLKVMFKALNFIKVPMPTVEFNEKGKAKFYPLYF